MNFSKAHIALHWNTARNHPRSLERSRQRTRIDGIKIEVRELLFQPCGLRSSDIVQRNIELALESLFAIPVGLAVTHEDHGAFDNELVVFTQSNSGCLLPHIRSPLFKERLLQLETSKR